MHDDQGIALLHCATDRGYRINISGELDIMAAAATAGGVEGFRRSTSADVLVDVAGVTFVDSAGSQFLTQLCVIAKARGGSIRLLNAQPKVLRVLILLGRVTSLDVPGRSVPPPS